MISPAGYSVLLIRLTWVSSRGIKLFGFIEGQSPVISMSLSIVFPILMIRVIILTSGGKSLSISSCFVDISSLLVEGLYLIPFGVAIP